MTVNIVLHTLTKEVYDDLLQVLREADADLCGIYDRWDGFMEPDDDDEEAATKTRKHLNKVYKALTGHDLEGGSSGDTK